MNNQVEDVKGRVIAFSIVAGVLGLQFIVALVLFIVFHVIGGVWVFPVFLGVGTLIFAVMVFEYGEVYKKYLLCVNNGHKAEAKIVKKVTNDIRSRRDFPGEPSWECTWDTVTVEYQGDDGKTYTSTFGTNKAGEVGTMMTVLQYDKYATICYTSEKMFEDGSDSSFLKVCTCGYKLLGNEFVCPSCGREIE